MVSGLAGEHSETGRKMSIMRIVQVLIRESDREHPLTQQEILDYMEEKYGMTVSRKSVGRNLSRLKEAGLPVMCREVSRVVNGKESSLSLDWYWDHELSREDLTVLIDLLYFSHLPYQQVRQLSERLKKLQSHTLKTEKKTSGISPLPRSGRIRQGRWPSFPGPWPKRSRFPSTMTITRPMESGTMTAPYPESPVSIKPAPTRLPHLMGNTSFSAVWREARKFLHFPLLLWRRYPLRRNPCGPRNP